MVATGVAPVTGAVIPGIAAKFTTVGGTTGAGAGGTTSGVGVTVTTHVAVKPPSTVVTVIVDVPTVNGVTTPLTDTVTIAGALEDQVTLLLVASVGTTVATNVPVASPAVKAMVALFKVTPVTATGVVNRQPVARRAVRITIQIVTKHFLLNIILSSFLNKVKPKSGYKIFTQIFYWIHLMISSCFQIIKLNY
jgi:hypothetical protein